MIAPISLLFPRAILSFLFSVLPPSFAALIFVHACSRAEFTVLMQVVLRKDAGGEWVAVESAVRVLALLNEVSKCHDRPSVFSLHHNAVLVHRYDHARYFSTPYFLHPIRGLFHA